MQASAPSGPPPGYQEYATPDKPLAGAVPPQPPQYASPHTFPRPVDQRTALTGAAGHSGYGAIGEYGEVRVVFVDGLPRCPVCRMGTPVRGATCCGLLMAIIFFPLGLICCLLTYETKCNVCGIRLQ